MPLKKHYKQPEFIKSTPQGLYTKPDNRNPWPLMQEKNVGDIPTETQKPIDICLLDTSPRADARTQISSNLSNEFQDRKAFLQKALLFLSHHTL